MPSRVMAHPFLTLLAVVSTILIVVGRINRDIWWGTGSLAPESRCSWLQAPSSSLQGADPRGRRVYRVGGP